MKTRIITGAAMAIAFLIALYFGQYFHIMTMLLSIIGAIAAWEIIHATGKKVGYQQNKVLEYLLYGICIIAPWMPHSQIALLLATFLHIAYFISFIIAKQNYLPYFMYSYVMVLLVSLALYSVSYFYQIDLYFLIFFVLLSSGTDVFAYFGGYFFGKHKLIPWVSPNKTIEGAIGGIVGAIGLSIGGQLFFEYVLNWEIPIIINFFEAPILWVTIIIILSILSQMGDLFFSKIKRFFDTKDYGVIFPGHGGILDRLDGVIFVTATFLIIVAILY